MNPSEQIRREQKRLLPDLNRVIQEATENLLSDRFVGPLLADGGAAHRAEADTQIGRGIRLVGSLSPEAKREMTQTLRERLAKDERAGGYQPARHEAVVIRGILGVEGR